jgi:hypothetical protein
VDIVARRAALLLPTLRIGKHDAKYAAAAIARLVKQYRTVELAQFARNE